LTVKKIDRLKNVTSRETSSISFLSNEGQRRAASNFKKCGKERFLLQINVCPPELSLLNRAHSTSRLLLLDFADAVAIERRPSLARKTN